MSDEPVGARPGGAEEVETSTASARPGAGAAPGLLQRLRSADFLISLFLLILFAAAFLAARDWPADSRLFPEMVTVTGMVLAVVKMVSALRPRPPVQAETRTRAGGVELTDEDDEADEALEYVFARASRRDWLRVLAWAAAFFLGLRIVGTVPTVLVFTVLYLLREARTTLLVAVVYAVLLAGLLYGATEALDIVLPRGIFTD